VIGTRDAHVWHCSLAFHPDEPDLSDGWWGEICEQFVGGCALAARGRKSLRACATTQAVSLDLELVAVTPAGNALGEGVEAIMLSVRALVLRFGLRGVCPWELAVCLTGGLLSG